LNNNILFHQAKKQGPTVAKALSKAEIYSAAV